MKKIWYEIRHWMKWYGQEVGLPHIQVGSFWHLLWLGLSFHTVSPMFICVMAELPSLKRRSKYASYHQLYNFTWWKPALLYSPWLVAFWDQLENILGKDSVKMRKNKNKNYTNCHDPLKLNRPGRCYMAYVNEHLYNKSHSIKFQNQFIVKKGDLSFLKYSSTFLLFSIFF